VRLALEGDHAAQQAREERRERRLGAVRKHSGNPYRLLRTGLPAEAWGGMASVIVLDASVLISYLDGDVSHHSAAQSLLVEAVDHDLGVNR